MAPIFRRLRALVLAGCAALAAAGASSAQSPPSPPERMRYDLIPWPRHLEPRPGEFALGPGVAVALSDPDHAELREIAAFLAEAVRGATGLRVPVEDETEAGSPRIQLRLEEGEEWPSDEAYRLSVSPHAVTLSAPTPRGLFHGVQTLRQLLPTSPDGGSAPAIPAVEIEDAPRFGWRGMHLDVSRHFFPVSFIKKYIDLLSLYHFNTFHWHLTDDQGWRIEIRRYPRLTEVGAWRRETRVGHALEPPERYDGTPHGGFYTHDEVREVVEHARRRYVTVVPEIEMPGHSRAALAAYPELACTEGPFEVATTWGIFEDVLCPREETFRFLEGVLEEVMELFPGPYVHVGGDEAPKRRWEESPVAREVMRREGLADAHELQGWFMRRVGRFLAARGRRMVGWDEILEGGLPPGATVMSWRGTEGGIAAARLGHDVVMTPDDTLYFDHYQAGPQGEPLAIGGMTTLADVYAYEPVPGVLTPEQARHVLGAQADLWTEYIATPEHVEYMVFPRMLALAEVLWSPREARAWEGFQARLPAHLRRLDALGVRYRPPR